MSYQYFWTLWMDRYKVKKKKKNRPMFIMLNISWFYKSCVNKQINDFFLNWEDYVIFVFSFFRMNSVPILNQIYITALVHWMSACVSTSYKKSSVRVDWKKSVYRSLQIMINLLAASIHQAYRIVWIICILLYLCTFIYFCPKTPEIFILQNKSYVTTMLLIDIKNIMIVFN